MPRVCAVSGKKTRFGNRVSTRGMAKAKGGVGIKITGITRRKFKPNLQSVRVLLPNGTVKRMKLAASVIRNGWITVKIDGKMRRVTLVKAVRGRNRPVETKAPDAAPVSPAATTAAPVQSAAADAAPATPATAPESTPDTKAEPEAPKE